MVIFCCQNFGSEKNLLRPDSTSKSACIQQIQHLMYSASKSAADADSNLAVSGRDC